MLFALCSVRSGRSGNQVVESAAGSKNRATTAAQASSAASSSRSATAAATVVPADGFHSTADGFGDPRTAAERRQVAAAGDLYANERRMPQQQAQDPYLSDMTQVGEAYGKTDALIGASLGRVPAAVGDGRRVRPTSMNFVSSSNAVDDDEYCSPDSAYHSPFGNGSNTALSANITLNGYEEQQRQWNASSKGHEKFPSWPPAASPQMSSAVATSGVGSRTSSWSGSAPQTNAAVEFTLAPRLGGSRVDEMPGPLLSSANTPRSMYDLSSSTPGATGVRRQRRSDADYLHQGPVASTRPTYPGGAVDDRSSRQRGRPSSDFIVPASGQMNRQTSYSKAMSYQLDSSGLEDSPAPPPLPASSPPRGPMPPSSSWSNGSTPERPGNYQCVARAPRPFYNTYTQTDPVTDGDESTVESSSRPAMRTSRSYSSAIQFSYGGLDSDVTSGVGGDVRLRRQQQRLLRTTDAAAAAGDAGAPLVAEMDAAEVAPPFDDHGVDQTNILRRLSQELYGQQSRFGPPTVRTAGDANSRAIAVAKSPDKRLPGSALAVLGNGISPTGNEVQQDAEVDAGSGCVGVAESESNFVRARKTQMSLRKAFGIFEEIDADVSVGVASKPAKSMPTLGETSEERATAAAERQPLYLSGAQPESSQIASREQFRSKERRTSDSFGYQPRRQRSDFQNTDAPLAAKARAMSVADAGQSLSDLSASQVHRLSYASDVHSSFSSSSGSAPGSVVGATPGYGVRTSGTDAGFSDVLMPANDVSDAARGASPNVQLRAKQKSTSLPRGMTPPDSSGYSSVSISSQSSVFSSFDAGDAYDQCRRRSFANNRQVNAVFLLCAMGDVYYG